MSLIHISTLIWKQKDCKKGTKSVALNEHANTHERLFGKSVIHVQNFESLRLESTPIYQLLIHFSHARSMPKRVRNQEEQSAGRLYAGQPTYIIANHLDFNIRTTEWLKEWYYSKFSSCPNDLHQNFGPPIVQKMIGSIQRLL